MANLIDGDIVKRYVYRGKLVLLIKVNTDEKTFYSFKITDKGTRRDCYSTVEFTTAEDCEKASFKTAKAM